MSVGVVASSCRGYAGGHKHNFRD